MDIVKGDLFAKGYQALGQGVNCKGAMGSGIAVEFKRRWPAMYAEYRELCKSGELQPGGLHAWQDPESGLWIYNMASQNNPGPDARLPWLSEAAGRALAHAHEQNISTVGIPAIACGIGGLTLDEVRPALNQVERNRYSHFSMVLWEQ